MNRRNALDLSELLMESERAFDELERLVRSDSEPDELKRAHIIAWRMARRLEESRLRHPII